MIPIDKSNTLHPILDKALTKAPNGIRSNSPLPATTAPQNKDEYYAISSAWGNEAPVGGGEMRDIAVVRIHHCLKWNSYFLDLEGLNISSLGSVRNSVSFQ